MEQYYSAIVFIVLTMLGTMIIHLFENQTLSRRVKKELILIAILIMTATLCEFLGIYLNNTTQELKVVHGIVKAIGFTISPIIPILYVRVIGFKYMGKSLKNCVFAIGIVNGIFEFISIKKPIIFYIDTNNVYRHGKFYVLYVVMYFIEILLFIIELLKYTKRYQSRNILTLISILTFLIFGFSIRMFDSTVYTDWLVVAITFLMFIIYYSDLALKVDPLTGLLNRKSYENRLKKLNYLTAIILLDVNDFKIVNDQFGHQYGDKILKIIAKTILNSYGKYGYCYRVGGDEFCVVLKPGKLEELLQKQKNRHDNYQVIENLNINFDKMLSKEYETHPVLRHGVSKGYGIYYAVNDEFKHNYYSKETVMEVVKIADERMYKDKNNKKVNNGF